MRAEIVAVGTELLLGDIVNSNAAWIGRELAAIGVDCHRHVTVGDNVERIASVIAEAAARADAVLITGGLGPTQDDVTREAIAAFTGRALVRDEAIVEALRARFASFGRPMPELNLRQADVPEGARVIELTFGTAPGLIVEHAGTMIAAVPGVPREMQDMFARAILPELAARAGAPIVSRVVRLCGISESGAAEQLAPLWDRLGGPVTMAFLAGSGEVRVRLTAREVAGLDDAEAVVREAFGPLVVGIDGDTLEVVVGALLRARGWTIACAESLTAGKVTARLVDVPGASGWVRGGVVAYDAAVKRDVLGVDEALVAEPVTEEVARAMAAGVRTRLGSDVGVSLTGVAGPEPHGGAEPGTVVVAVDGPLGEAARTLRLPGDRPTVQTLATATALNLVRLYLIEELR